METPIPSASGLIQAVDSVKNITVALIVLAIACYCTVTPNIPEKFTQTWLDWAAAVVFVYVGKRTAGAGG